MTTDGRGALGPPSGDLDTNLGRVVTVRVDGAGRRVVHKELTGVDRQTSNELLEMAEQWRCVETVTGLQLYPSLHELDRTYVTLEYYDQLSLDRCTDRRQGEDLARRALSQLLLAVTEARHVDSGVGSSAFLASELDGRLRRLRAVEAQLPSSLRSIVATCERFHQRSGLERLTDSVVPLSVHGDLGLNNVVHDAAGRIAFIDTRARWTPDGLPVWDVALDLATLFIFTTEIQPVLATYGFGHASPLHESPHTLLSIIDDVVRTSGWDALDPDWRRRFSIGCAVRLIGSIGANLLSARRAATERVGAVVALTASFLRRCRSNAMPPWD